MFRKILFWVGVLLVQISIFYYLSSQKWAIDLHAQFFEWQKPFHITLFAYFPFSVGDVLYLILIFTLIYFLIKIKTFKVKLLLLVNIFYFLYQIFWGMLYFQTPIKLHYSEYEISKKEIEIITYKYLNICKLSRSQLSENEKGIFKITDVQEIENAILQSQKSLPLHLKKKEIPKASFKKSLFSLLMNYTGIAGYYNPFTASAHYNENLPATHLPFTIAHENAHQMGFAREQEANFIGFLLGNQSENEELRYSANWYALKSLLRFQRQENPFFVEKMMTQFSEEMKRDIANERAFYEQYNGKTAYFFSFLNDVFLKSNQQEGSITYDYFVELLLLHEKSQ